MAPPINDQSWDARYEELKEYKAEHGDCRVPTNNNPKNPGLGIWVSKQRQLYKKGSLLKDRAERLERIGFLWKANTTMNWDDRIKKLVEFKKKHGHLYVPNTYPEIGSWAQELRKTHRRRNHRSQPLSKVHRDRIPILEELGFEWEPPKNPRGGEDCVSSASNDGVQGRMEETKLPKEETECGGPDDRKQSGDDMVAGGSPIKKECIDVPIGDAAISADVPVEKFTPGSASSAPKSTVQQGSPLDVDDDCMQAGKSGTDWIQHEKENECSDSSATEDSHNDFRGERENGNSKNGGNGDSQAGNQTDEIHGKTVSSAKKSPVLSPGALRLRAANAEAWNKRYEELKQYKSEHGNLKVPCTNISLQKWATRQRHLNKKGLLAKDRVERLKMIGLLWVKPSWEQDWEARFKMLVDFKRKYGHCSIPHGDPVLGKWVTEQRSMYKSVWSKKFRERIPLLEELGFEWDGMKAKYCEPDKSSASAGVRGSFIEDKDLPIEESAPVGLDETTVTKQSGGVTEDIFPGATGVAAVSAEGTVEDVTEWREKVLQLETQNFLLQEKLAASEKKHGEEVQRITTKLNESHRKEMEQQQSTHLQQLKALQEELKNARNRIAAESTSRFFDGTGRMHL